MHLGNLFFLPNASRSCRHVCWCAWANVDHGAAGVITAIGAITLQGLKVDANNATKSIDELRDSFAELTSESKEQKRDDVAATIDQLFRYKELQERLAEIREEYKGQAFATSKNT